MTRLLTCFLFLLSTSGIGASELTGTVKLESKRRIGTVSVTNAVVFYRPDETETEAVSADSNATDRTTTTVSDPPQAEKETDKLSSQPMKTATLEFPDETVSHHPVEMTMDRKAFKPLVISVDVGTEVNFPNADRVLHNAFSTTKGAEFDLGFYPQGEERSRVFNKAGLVTVYCNVHQNMVGYVLVMDTPYHTRPEEDGSFKLSGLPEGTGKLYIWHPRGRTYSEAVTIEQEPATVNAALSLTKRLVPNHANKFGKPYRRSRDY